MKKLTEEEINQAKEFLKVGYRNAYACSKCGKIYGSDVVHERNTCPQCIKETEKPKHHNIKSTLKKPEEI